MSSSHAFRDAIRRTPSSPPAPSSAGPQERSSGKRRPGAKRYTVDLEASEHRAFIVWCIDAEVERVEAMRAFVRLLERDTVFGDQVRDEVLRARGASSEQT